MDFEEILDNWKLIAMRSIDHFKSSTLLLHHIVQFLAISGRYLVLKLKHDNSQLIEWHPSRQMFLGKWFDSNKYPIKIGVQLPELRLVIIKPPFSVIEALDINGCSTINIYEWLHHKLSCFGADTRRMAMEMPYLVPSLAKDDSIPIEITNSKEFRELCMLRSNTHLILKYFAAYFQNLDYRTQIGICSEKFNSELYVPMLRDHYSKIRSYIKLGLSVPDSYIDHYYFYLKIWPTQNTYDFYRKLRKLKGGGYWKDFDRLKAVLPLNILYKDKTADAQKSRVLSFFYSTIENSYELLGINMQDKR